MAILDGHVSDNINAYGGGYAMPYGGGYDRGGCGPGIQATLDVGRAFDCDRGRDRDCGRSRGGHDHCDNDDVKKSVIALSQRVDSIYTDTKIDGLKDSICEARHEIGKLDAKIDYGFREVIKEFECVTDKIISNANSNTTLIITTNELAEERAKNRCVTRDLDKAREDKMLSQFSIFGDNLANLNSNVVDVAGKIK